MMSESTQTTPAPPEEPRLVDILDYEKISGHLFTRALWASFLKLFFKFYIRVKIKGRLKGFYQKYPKLILISNHTSHLDGPVILSIIPFVYWTDLYILAAQDYWFSNGFLRFFSKHFMKAIPVDRSKRRLESFKNCINIMSSLKRAWMIMFPEGTRSQDGSLKTFKKGVSLLSQKTATPVLFLYMKGNRELFPKGKILPRPGKIHLYIGPVQAPGNIDTIFNNYKKWTDELEIKIQQKTKRFLRWKKYSMPSSNSHHPSSPEPANDKTAKPL